VTELLAAGGCGNDNRIARDGAGAGARDWLDAVGAANVTLHQLNVAIVAFNIDADDMNDATDATFKLQWRNVSDAGSFADLAATGEMKWSSSSDLVDDATVVEAEESGANSINCANKGWSRRDGLEKEGANGFTRTITQDAHEDFQWAVALDSADHANSDQYEFRLTQSDATVIKLGTTKLTVVTAGKISGTTKDDDRSAAEVSVTVTAIESDGGSPEKPTGPVVAQVVSSGSDGTYSLEGNILSGNVYFLHGWADKASDVSDGSPPITAVDRV